MANDEHLALLKQGVDAWNDWKANNPGIRPDLSFATGKGITIRGAKLSGVDLSRANLSRADLSRADLIGANLKEANFNEAYLSGADLIGADLSEADLSGADLIGANLIGTNLSGAKLNGVDLSKANLSGTDLSGAKLIGAKLSGTNLSGAKLCDANLSGAHLKGANLKGSNLSRANLCMANLTDAYLQRTKVQNTNFNKAILTGACLENWHINSGTNLDEVICEYVYLQADQKERRPQNGNFALGEFTQLFQKALETVDMIFDYGIDWQAFFTSFQKLQSERGNSELFIQAIENRNNGSCVIRVNIPPNANKLEIEVYLKREYEHQLKIIDNKYRYQLQAKYEQIATYRQQSADLTEIIKVMASRAVPLENNEGVADEFIPGVTIFPQAIIPENSFLTITGKGNKTPPKQHNYSLEQKQTLIDTATKIQKLLQQLEQTYPTNTPLEKQVVVTEVIKRIESNPNLKSWVIGAMKGISIEALKELVNHPLVNVLMAALEGYQDVD